jgi:hypothetical protein
MSSTLNISILLRKDWRTAEGIARVKEIVGSLGIRPSASGRVSISCKIPIESFVKLFQVSPTPVEPKAPGESDFGSPGGYMVETELQIPTQLKEYVEAISLVSPAVRLR